jgi:glutathione S-transferase
MGKADTRLDGLPVLYSFRRCPYAMRARMALSRSNTVCALREVILRDKPAEMLAASSKGTVPVIVLQDGTIIDESIDVMLWSLGHHDPDDWLAPAHDKMMALIEEADGPFKTHLDRYKYGTRYPGEAPLQHRTDGLVFLEKLDAILSSSPYLFGDSPALVDIAIFPFVRQFANTDRAWFDAQPLPSLQAWLAGWLASDLFKGVMQKWPVWQAGDPEPLFPNEDTP